MNTVIPENFRLCENKFRQLLTSRQFGKTFIFYESVTSTFDAAKNLTLSHGDVVCARVQTGGVGRMGRQWSSEEGGIYFSLILCPDEKNTNFQLLTSACALGVQKALSHYTECKIKWPNDIVSASGKKLCGILTKGYFEGNGKPVFNVGVGINANTTVFDPSLKFAGSLKTELNEWVDENEVLARVLSETEKVIENGNAEKLMEEYSGLCVTLGRTVKIIYPETGKELVGEALKTNIDGSLVIKTETHGTICVNSGEVSVRGIYDESYV